MTTMNKQNGSDRTVESVLDRFYRSVPVSADRWRELTAEEHEEVWRRCYRRGLCVVHDDELVRAVADPRD